MERLGTLAIVICVTADCAIWPQAGQAQPQEGHDLNPDGRVTILEQTQGRHPLSTIVDPAAVANSNQKIPWAYLTGEK